MAQHSLPHSVSHGRSRSQSSPSSPSSPSSQPSQSSQHSTDGFPFELQSPSSTQSGSMPSTPKSTSFGGTVASPSVRGSATLSGSVFGVTKHDMARHLDEQASFATKRETLVRSLDSTTTLVKSLAAFNQEKWTIHYPHRLGVDATSNGSQRDPLVTPVRSSSARLPALRRSATLQPSEDAPDDSPDEHSASSKRPSPQRAWSTVDTPNNATAQASTSSLVAPAHPLSILSLDLKLGHPAAATAALPALLPSLSVATLSQLLSRRLTSSLTHISSLRSRVVDTNSRILVTGDLNAGKSTFVNALLRRDLMPSDQQPCTAVFCEVLDASSFNDGVEGLHAVRDIGAYDPTKPETFDSFDLTQVQEVQDAEEPYQIIKAYVHDNRAPAVETEPNPSFIKNGLVSISLIDAPGLNRDTLSTTALFARQSEIDVIVFVVSAENHFTLSAKEFLWNASREKAYVFIVVNKWGAIKDKARCMRLVGQQIKQLSPATWEARHELVHFVDAADVVESDSAAPAQVVVEDCKFAEESVDEKEPTAFDLLEQSLRSFVLLKRTTSKLAPAKNYLLNLLADLSTLAETNVTAASEQLAEALRQLERVRPIHERLSAQRDEVEAGVDRVEETAVEAVRFSAWSRLERALGYVAEGQIVPPQASDANRRRFEDADQLVAPASLPEYAGLAGLWDWANEVKKTLVKALEAEVRIAEDEARIQTSAGVEQVMHGLGERYLPSAAVEERTAVAAQDGQDPVGSQVAAATPKKQNRVFRPEVMFAKRRRGIGRLAARGVSTGLGLGTGATGLSSTSWSATDFEVSIFDLFDLERLYSHGSRLRGKKTHDDDLVETSTILGLGVGTIGMLGSRVIGVKGTMDSITRIFEVLGSDKAKKWAAPILGLITVGFVTYVIIDLPRAIPRNIGRKLQASLASSDALVSAPSSPSAPTAATQPPVTFASAHSERIARETRKVLRLAGWDLRERFRAALDQSAAERKEVESTVSKAEGALKWLAEFENKVAQEDSKVESVVV
ncbi:BZ3500_MvSof-1268-A1-R1_Chr10-1g02670 [Microbotryum saponariae]|uniref:BZ3500_MvSof-1268-A1-R1_Chr10-1g02670 protein n=1 Tax=Microbotryum saponariae TaxID=289078 RepID=A0A2X0LJW3_9BASI|nr:BZ3500_MvSof-1268-A1-R1_Chr10-1g02670 [Microbotryum saponariae]SDA06159.1 BZ3501_MvSof-1269-A2-R1_Chr10-1g02271 [Microbotryum saponariae]